MNCPEEIKLLALQIIMNVFVRNSHSHFIFLLYSIKKRLLEFLYEKKIVPFSFYIFVCMIVKHIFLFSVRFLPYLSTTLLLWTFSPLLPYTIIKPS